MTSMDKAFGRVPQIERADRQFGGFLTLFAKLPSRTQQEVLAEICRLKEESNGNQEVLLEKVRALAEMYGAFSKSNENLPQESPSQTLTVQLGEIENAAQELMKVGSFEQK